MRYLFLLLFVFLAACQVSPETAARIEAATTKIVAAADRDQDGRVTITEVGGVANDPTAWIAIGSALLGLFGIGKAQAASANAAKAQRDADELYDRTHKPVVPTS